MAVVYFTSNASTGAGSLVEAVGNASPGDVIRPDETVFERGSTIEIVLASPLNVDKDLTLDASPFRVRLDGGGSVACVAIATGRSVVFTSFDVIGGATTQNGGGLNVANGANVVLNRCLICGCDAATSGGGIYVGDGATLTLTDFAAFGNRAQSGGGIFVGDGATLTLTGATVCGNVDADSDVDIYGETSTSTLIAVNSIIGNVFDDADTMGSVVNVAPSSVGFVASPPDDLTPENWNANAWQDWNLRLLDDASGAPSPYRDSGDVGAMSRYDLDGNFRGRETNGVATCSPGAYETIQADLFWVGRDATGAEVVSPSFLTSDGWAASRFATVSGDVAPQAGQTLFIGRDVAFVDRLSYPTISTKPRHKVVIGGGAVVSTVRPTESGWQVNYVNLDMGACSTFSENNVSLKTLCGSARFGDFAYCGARLGGGISEIAFGFDYVGSNVVFTGFVTSSNLDERPFYRALTVYRRSQTFAPQYPLNGTYRCGNLSILARSPYQSLLIESRPGTRFVCQTFEFGEDETEMGSWLTNPIIIELYGEASVNSSGTGLRYADEFSVDVSAATSATLKLSGQKIYGDAPDCAIVLASGRSARVVNDVLSCASLTLNANAKLTLENATVKANALTIRNGATVEFANDASVILTTVSVMSATATGPGAFFAPTAAPEGLTLENGAIWGDATAGVTSLDLDPISATTAMFTVVKTNADANIVAQYSDDDGATWRTVETTAGADEYELTVAQGADVTVRVATATGWLTDTVSTAPFLPVWTVSNGYEMAAGVSNVFEIATGGSNDGLNTYDFNNYGYL